MNRQIKFRVWDTRFADPCMTYIEDLYWFEEGYVHSFNGDDCLVFQQFTGLTDKNGKEIYEGDFVNYVYKPGDGYWSHDGIGLISWRSTGFHFDSKQWVAYLTSCPGLFDNNNPNQLLEIVGNIFENPELLEKLK